MVCGRVNLGLPTAVSEEQFDVAVVGICLRVCSRGNPRLLGKEAAQGAEEPAARPISDTYRVAKTVLHQSFLLPLPQIVQPVMWAYALDTLSLMP